MNPIYYVMFTTSTIFASVLLFQGFNTGGAAAVSLLGGFLTTFLGVYLLNLTKSHNTDGPRPSRLSTHERGRSFSGVRRPSQERLNDSFELAPNVESHHSQPFVLDQDEGEALPRFHDIPRAV